MIIEGLFLDNGMHISATYEENRGAARLNRTPLFLMVAFAAVLMVLLPGCGKKAPPFLPEKKFPLRVDQLEGKWEKGRVVLGGYVRAEDKELSHVKGCRVYHSWYPVDDPPCETCPIEMAGFEVIKEKVVSDNRFNCEILDAKKKGIWFFEVRLIGRNGALGPPSDKVKLRIND